MLQRRGELLIWFDTWLRNRATETIEQFVSHSIKKIILNPYPLLEKSNKDVVLRTTGKIDLSSRLISLLDSLSRMIYAALESIQHAKPNDEIDEYLCDVISQIYVGQTARHALSTLYEINDTIDYMLCSKVYVFKTLMAFYDCSLCDETTNVIVDERGNQWSTSLSI